MRALGEELDDRREDTVRNDPYAREAGKILETARTRLLAAVVAGDVTEAVRLTDVFARAALLKEETEDGVRVRLGLLTQDEARCRAASRRLPLGDAILPLRRRGLVFRPPLAFREPRAFRGLRAGGHGLGEGHLQAIVGSTPM